PLVPGIDEPPGRSPPVAAALAFVGARRVPLPPRLRSRRTTVSPAMAHNSSAPPVSVSTSVLVPPETALAGAAAAGAAPGGTRTAAVKAPAVAGHRRRRELPGRVTVPAAALGLARVSAITWQAGVLGPVPKAARLRAPDM